MPPNKIRIAVCRRIPALVLYKGIVTPQIVMGAPHTGQFGSRADGIFKSFCAAAIFRTASSLS